MNTISSLTLRTLRPRPSLSVRRLFGDAPVELRHSDASAKIVSRRGWQAYVQKYPRKIEAKKKVEDKTEWPKSVRYSTYAASAVLVPYFAVWFAASNRRAREAVFPLLSDGLREKLRSYFGMEDLDALSYTEIVEEHRTVPRRLDQELSEKERLQQSQIESILRSDVAIRLQTVEDDNVTVHADDTYRRIPASTPGNVSTLLHVLGDSANSTSSNVSVAVDFPQDKTADTIGDEFLENSFDKVDSPKDPLLSTIHTYSLWHYQPSAASRSTQQTSSSAGISSDDVNRSWLVQQVDLLERELRGASTRPVDDILEELNQAKSELRALRWKRFLPWRN